MDTTAAHLNELVDVVKNFGLSVLPASFSRPPHMQVPTWRQLPGLTKVGVIAEWRSNSTAHGRPVRMDDALPARGGLYFRAMINSGENVPDNCAVHWRITNTGIEALTKRAGRGGFYTQNRSGGHWETLQYRGVHITEAFVVRRSDDILVAKSDAFYVLIE
jgi:hypothetical protein